MMQYCVDEVIVDRDCRYANTWPKLMPASTGRKSLPLDNRCELQLLLTISLVSTLIYTFFAYNLLMLHIWS